MKIVQRVQEIWSGHKSVTDGLTYEGHSYNPTTRLGGGLIFSIEIVPIWTSSPKLLDGYYIINSQMSLAN